MVVYWTMFILPALLALVEPAARRLTAFNLLLFAVVASLWVVIAFRETGGDYTVYLELFRAIHGRDLLDTLFLSNMTDPGYMFLNWASDYLDFGLYGVNAVCASIFLISLYFFVQDEPKPILATAVAVAYLVIVVVIGYTRQGTAIGMLMLAIGRIRRYQPVKAALFIALASLFHSTAAVFFPLVYFAVKVRSETGLWMMRVFVIAAALWGVWHVLGERSDEFITSYVSNSHYASDGAFVRSLMSGLAAAIFFAFYGKWRRQYDDARIWLVYAIAALAAVPGSLIASTAVDRMGLYLLPLQIVVFGRLPDLVPDFLNRRVVVVSVVACYTVTLAVWLHFGQFAGVLWLPYKSAVFGTVS